MFKFLVAMIMLAAASAQSSPGATPSCPVNQYLALCGRMCEPTCGNPMPNREFCPRLECSPFTASCRCSNGYVRNLNNNQCILLANCPPNQ
ncbi:uncharacterized protein LOC144477569 [Augochlora pura]